MSVDVSIRPFRAEDLPRPQQIREAAFRPVFRSFRNMVGEEISALAFAAAEAEQATLLNDLCKPDASEDVFVAEMGSDLVGFVAISLDQTKKIGEIGLNAVHPRQAGLGIGTQLYRFALAFMREADMVTATVGTGGDPSHAAAGLYEGGIRQGYPVGLALPAAVSL